MNGRLTDVIIEDEYFTDERTGIRQIGRSMIVWADMEMKESLKMIEGISTVIVHLDIPTRYYVYIDPRYDREFLKAEIEAVCKGA